MPSEFRTRKLVIPPSMTRTLIQWRNALLRAVREVRQGPRQFVAPGECMSLSNPGAGDPPCGRPPSVAANAIE